MSAPAFGSVLTEVVRTKKAGEALELIDSGVDLGEADDNGRTALHYAARRGMQDVLEVLIDANVAIDPQDNWGRTPLFEAAQTANHAIAALLLKAGAKVNHRDKEGLTPLHLAAGSGHLAVVNLLLRKGADSMARSKDLGRTPLHRAAEAGHTPVLRMLVEQGALPNVSDDLDQTPLSLAQRAGHTDAIAFLETALGRGEEGEVKKLEKRKPPEMLAAPKMRPETLLGAWRNAFDTLSASALAQYADNGGDLNAPHPETGNTLLHQAARQGVGSTVAWLLDHRASVNVKNNAGFTPLHFAAAAGELTAAAILVQRGAKRDVFILCAMGETEEIRQGIAEGSIAVEAVDGLGQRPIHWCAAQGQVKTASMLVAAGANAWAKTPQGLSATDIAAKQNQKRFLQYLKDLAASPK